MNARTLESWRGGRALGDLVKGLGRREGLVTLGEPIGLTLLERLAAPGPARVRRAGA